MSDQTLIGQVLDALRTTWAAESTLADLVTAGTLGIFDGPPVTNRAFPVELWVGSSGQDPEEVAAAGIQELVDFEADVDESMDVTCAIWAAQGNIDVAAGRTAALAVFNLAAAAVRGSSLGLSTLRPVTHVSAWDLRQGQYSTGAGVVVVFTVHLEGMV